MTSQALQFKQPLRSSSNSELAKRLRTLHEELRDFDQELVDASSLDRVAKELIHPSLLLHKDKGVKAFAGACLVDILRLYAPEAPYTQVELQGLFEFLVRQFKKVGDPKDPHQSEYYYIVDSLATVKSIVLVCDLESGSDKLVEQIFRECFDAISSVSPKNVEIALSDILLSIIEELPSLPPPVTEALLSHFQPHTITARPAAFRLAVEVCRGASDKLQRYVSQYFAEVIQDAVEGKNDSDVDSDEDEVDDDSDDEDHRPASRRKRNGKAKGKAAKGVAGSDTADLPPALVSAHGLIRSLNRHAPSLLLNVIPLLSSELTSTTSPKYRRLATTCLGAMFADKHGAGDLAASFPSVWKEWTKRTADVHPTVRIAVAGCLRKIWTEHAELSTDIEAILRKLLTDSDEKVRLAACETFDEIDYETACHHVSTPMLRSVGERTVDRKDKVRQIAYRTLGRLFNLAYTELDSRDDHVVQHFGWIPGVLLDGLAYGDTAVQTGTNSFQSHLVSRTFAEYILPLPNSETFSDEDIPAWVDRFLTVEQLLDDATSSQRRALLNLTRLTEGRNGSVWEAYVQACEANNSGIIDDKDKEAGIKEFLARTIKAIASRMPDPTKATEDLRTFAKQNVGQLYRELKIMLDPQTDLKAFLKNERDFMRRVEKMSGSVASTFSAFIALSCYTFVNRSSIPQLLKRLVSASPDPQAQAAAHGARRTLAYIAKTRPVLFKAHVAELSKLVTSHSNDSKQPDELAEQAVGSGLQALAKLKLVEKSFVLDSKLAKRAAKMANETKNAEIAKYAAMLVALDDTRGASADELVESLANALPEDAPDDLVPHLAALAKLAKYGHDSFEHRSEQVTVQCLEILRRDTRSTETPREAESTWVEDAELHPLTSARLLALKVLTNRCVPFARTPSSSTVATPVFGLLWKLVGIGRDGSEGEDDSAVSSRLRLAASTSILKLLTTKDPAFVKIVVKNFTALTRTTQDMCFEVRDGYVRKLLQYLRNNQIHPAIVPYFHLSLFLIAHDPEEEIKQQVIKFAKSRSRRPDRQTMWELPFVRLFSLLARHPDCEGIHAVDEYRMMSKYFELYLECLATSENISLLYHLAQLVKSARDSTSSAFDQNLYTLSELAQHLIKTFAERHNWPLTTLPKSKNAIKLPADAFKVITDPAELQRISRTVYLPEAATKELDVKEKKVSVPRKRKAATQTKQGPKKTKRATKAARVKKHDWDSSDSGDAEDSSDSEEEDDAPGQAETRAPKNSTARSKQTNSATLTRNGLRSEKGRKSMKEQDDEEEHESGSEAEPHEGSDAHMSVDETEETQATTKTRPKTKATVRTKNQGKMKGAGSADAAAQAKSPAVRRALRGLAQPRPIANKADLELVSDLDESEPDEDDEE